jgi:hypothetical protein
MVEKTGKIIKKRDRREYDKERYEANKEEIKQYNLDAYHANPEEKTEGQRIF